MRKVYNRAGEEKLLDEVDVREHVATGRWSREPFSAPTDELTFLDEHNPEVNPELNGDGPLFNQDNFNQQMDAENNLDPTSQEAYNQREAEFLASQQSAESNVLPIEEEIKKSRSKK